MATQICSRKVSVRPYARLSAAPFAFPLRMTLGGSGSSRPFPSHRRTLAPNPVRSGHQPPPSSCVTFHERASKRPVISLLASNCTCQKQRYFRPENDPSPDHHSAIPGSFPLAPRSILNPACVICAMGFRHSSHVGPIATFHRIASKTPVISHLAPNCTSQKQRCFRSGNYPPPDRHAAVPGSLVPTAKPFVVYQFICGLWLLTNGGPP